MKCLFVDYYRPDEKVWNKRWEDLAVSGEIVGTEGLDARLGQEGANITLVVMHAIDDTAYIVFEVRFHVVGVLGV